MNLERACQEMQQPYHQTDFLRAGLLLVCSTR